MNKFDKKILFHFKNRNMHCRVFRTLDIYMKMKMKFLFVPKKSTILHYIQITY